MCAFGFYSDLFETGEYEVVGNYFVTKHLLWFLRTIKGVDEGEELTAERNDTDETAVAFEGQ